MLIVGLLGPAGAGKSTVASYLVEHYDATRYSLASPLKEMLGRALEFSDEQLYGTQAQKEAPDERYGGKSARWFLQHIGTQGCRGTFGEDFWVTQTLAKIEHDKPKLAVIEDCRFKNETRAILDVGGFVWRLESPDRESTADAAHQSESEWMNADYSIAIKPCKRSLELLYWHVENSLYEIGLERSSNQLTLPGIA